MGATVELVEEMAAHLVDCVEVMVQREGASKVACAVAKVAIGVACLAEVTVDLAVVPATEHAEVAARPEKEEQSESFHT